MSKHPKAAEQPKVADQSKAIETLVAIADLVLSYRNSDKPSLREVARITDRASGLLLLNDRDEKQRVANAATIQLVKTRNLVS